MRFTFVMMNLRRQFLITEWSCRSCHLLDSTIHIPKILMTTAGNCEKEIFINSIFSLILNIRMLKRRSTLYVSYNTQFIQ